MYGKHLRQRAYDFLVWTCLACASLIGLPVTTAQAQVSTSQQDYQRAQNLFLQGRKLVLQKQFKQALKRYADAIHLLKSASRTAASQKEKDKYRNARAGMLYIVGRTYQLDKQPANAYRAYLRCRMANPSPKLAQIVERFLARLRPRVVASLEITTVPAGARVKITDSVGQVQRTTAPLFQKITPGAATLVLQYPGYETQTLRLKLAPQSRVSHTIALQRIRRVVPQPPTTSPNRGATIGMWVSAVIAGAAGLAGISLLAVGIPQEQSGLVCYGQATKPECATQTDATIADAVEGGQTLKFAGIAMLVVGGIAAGSAIFFYTRQSKSSPRTAAHIKHTAPTHAATLHLAQ